MHLVSELDSIANVFILYQINSGPIVIFINYL